MNIAFRIKLKSHLVGALLLSILAGSVTADVIKTFPSFDVGGYAMLDYDQYGAFYNKDAGESQSHFELRRSKLSFNLQAHKNLKAQIQLTYDKKYRSEAKFELARAHVSYSGLPGFNVRVGKMKEPYSLEYQTSSKKLATIERSLMTTAFSPGSNYGVQLYEKKKVYTWALGLFQEEQDDVNNDKTKAISARATYAFYDDTHSVFHVGSSISLRELSGKKLKYKERGEVNSAANIIRSASFNADTLHLLQFESAWSYGPLRLQGEAALVSIKQEGGTLWQYSGFYLQGSYLLSGEAYRYKKGMFKGVKPSSSKGSWELVARYSGLNLRDNQLGSETSIVLLGVNYYASQKLRLMANLLVPSISGNVVNTDQSGNAISLRGQYQF